MLDKTTQEIRMLRNIGTISNSINITEYFDVSSKWPLFQNKFDLVA